MEKTSSYDIARMWCSWNAKLLEEVDFTEAYGISPKDFFRENKKLCLSEWAIYHEKVAFNAETDRATAKRPTEGCVCSWEVAQGPNDTRGGGKEGVRLWWCPVHKNTCEVYPKKESPNPENV
jgi:hypothetical protein